MPSSSALPQHYLMYLRKSRADIEAESRGEADVLARHEAELMRTAHRLGITVSQVYREVVSGDTISDRPMMRRLLDEVEHGLWAGVLVMEVPRLARGDTVDQGVVARAFSLSHTLIITPQKTYDPANEFDEEYLEFGLFMSRREYKVINRRMQLGREASVREGKYVGSTAPFGYRRVKIPKEKGWTLEPDENAPVVQQIFQLYTRDSSPLGVSRIVRYLNDNHVPSCKGGVWTNAMIQNILSSDIYAGFLSWGRRRTVKSSHQGQISTSRPWAEEHLRVPGLHPPLVSPEVFELAQTLRQKNPGRPGPQTMQNPLSGLVFCSACGHAMVRRPYKTGHQPSLICYLTSCSMVASDLDRVEASLLSSLRDYLHDLETGVAAESALSPGTDLSDAISRQESALAELEQQQQKAFELVERGVYSDAQFLLRSQVLNTRKEDILSRLNDLRLSQQKARDALTRREQIIPQVRHVLASYPTATVEDKNALLRTVLTRVYYTKTVRRSRSGSDDGDLSLSIVPLVPAD